MLCPVNRSRILSTILKLPAAQRARLANEIVSSLDEAADSDSTQAWLEELDRRVREVNRGKVKLQPWRAVRRKIEARLRAHRV